MYRPSKWPLFVPPEMDTAAYSHPPYRPLASGLAPRSLDRHSPAGLAAPVRVLPPRPTAAYTAGTWVFGSGTGSNSSLFTTPPTNWWSRSELPTGRAFLVVGSLLTVLSSTRHELPPSVETMNPTPLAEYVYGLVNELVESSPVPAMMMLRPGSPV